MAAPQTFERDEGQPAFKLTEKQDEAIDLMATTALERIMLYGGSRSGKTFVGVYAIITRALMAPNSRHAIIRHRFNAVKTTVGMDTLPKVMSIAYPGVPYTIDRQEWVVKLGNGAEIWLLGLDDKKRTEKVLGFEFATMYFNECSQLSWSSIEMGLTRLAQNCTKSNGALLKLLALFDCNPPGKAHWTYRHFVLKQDPTSKKPFAFPEALGWLQMNPADNRDNLPESYFRTLAGLSGAARKRFERGEFADDMDGALWTQAQIDGARSEKPAQLSRIVVAVDPSGASGPDDYRSDEIGIVVVGLDRDKVGHVLEDATLRGSPTEWGGRVINLYKRYKADCIVAEKNYGGAMVEAVIRGVDRAAKVKMVSATRAKHVRAEPVADLTTRGLFKFAGEFPELEDQLTSFLASGYIGEKSPDRADAAIWGATELLVDGGSSYTLANL